MFFGHVSNPVFKRLDNANNKQNSEPKKKLKSWQAVPKTWLKTKNVHYFRQTKNQKLSADFKTEKQYCKTTKNLIFKNLQTINNLTEK